MIGVLDVAGEVCIKWSGEVCIKYFTYLHVIAYTLYRYTSLCAYKNTNDIGILHFVAPSMYYYCISRDAKKNVMIEDRFGKHILID